MNTIQMRISDPQASHKADENQILDELLAFQGASVLELGCGSAEKTRFVAQKAAYVLALDVDERQLAKNREIAVLKNVIFKHGGAEKIPATEKSYDIVLMFKSLHHVVIDQMDEAFLEIHRVLKPGGILYISEPVYDGAFNDILKIFNDEKLVREAAFAAEQRAVASHKFSLERQKFFLQPIHFDSFSQFEEQSINVTYANRTLSPKKYLEVYAQFGKHMTSDGADFVMPIRVDVLKREA